MHVLFDLDGTLTDPKRGITRSIAYALDRLGIPGVDANSLTWCIGPPLRQSLAVLLETEDRPTVERALGYYRERFAEVGLFENAVYDGIPEALERLRGHTLHVATSKPELFANRILERFGLAPFFTTVVGSELDGTRDTKGEVIGHLLRSAQLRLESAVMVGDRVHDVRGAQDHGLPCVGVLYGYGDATELASADLVCATPADLPEAIQLCFRARQASAVIPNISMSKSDPSERTPSW